VDAEYVIAVFFAGTEACYHGDGKDDYSLVADGILHKRANLRDMKLSGRRFF
jgi:hypothetical protein